MIEEGDLCGDDNSEEINDPVREIANSAAYWLSKVKSSDVTPSSKWAALRLLRDCHVPHPPLAPPEELIRLIQYLLLPGRHERTKRENPFADDPRMDLEYREIGRGWGFLRPQPEIVLLIQDFLIPFELKHDPDPSGARPSVASDIDVAKHLEKQTAQVREWRTKRQIIDEVQWYREI